MGRLSPVSPLPRAAAGKISRLALGEWDFAQGFHTGQPMTAAEASQKLGALGIEADVILHVRDVSHEDTEAQSQDVECVLTALGIDPGLRPENLSPADYVRIAQALTA